MDLVAEFITDPRMEEFLSRIVKQTVDENNIKFLNESITEAEARVILGNISVRQMSRYRETGLKFVPGKPYTYIRKDCYEYRDNNILKKRNNMFPVK